MDRPQEKPTEAGQLAGLSGAVCSAAVLDQVMKVAAATSALDCDQPNRSGAYADILFAPIFRSSLIPDAGDTYEGLVPRDTDGERCIGVSDRAGGGTSPWPLRLPSRNANGEALSEREELRRNDPDIDPLGAMAIYRLTLTWPDIDGLLAVLNERTSLLDAIVVDRKLVGPVAD
jgi:hypothetical protein